MKQVTYNGVTFNAEWVATKTLAEFIAHESHHGLTAVQLKEAHELCLAAVKPAEPEEEAD